MDVDYFGSARELTKTARRIFGELESRHHAALVGGELDSLVAKAAMIIFALDHAQTLAGAAVTDLYGDGNVFDLRAKRRDAILNDHPWAVHLRSAARRVYAGEMMTWSSLEETFASKAVVASLEKMISRSSALIEELSATSVPSVRA